MNTETLPGFIFQDEINRSARYIVHRATRTRDYLPVILKSFGGDSLRDILKLPNFSLKQFLACAITLARTLGEIQKAKIIHKDNKPGNIILNPDTGALKITDFGISTRLNRETASYSATNALEDSLA